MSAGQDIINITTIINTGYVMQNYKNPSTNPSSPTPIDHNSEYMVASYGTAISGSGGADLVIQAQPGDVLRWFGISEANNFDNEVIIYGAPFYNGTAVFTTPIFIQSADDIMVPPTNYPTAPATQQTVKMWFLEATIDQYGTGSYQVQFAIYTTNSAGVSQLYGYFQWDPQVQANQPS